MKNTIIKKPTLVLDKKKCIANIKMMLTKAKNANIDFRPHFKTHQSAKIGSWFKELGVEKITVSSVEMAQYFANNNWKDITIAVPVNILEIEEINKLAEKITLNLIVESAGIVNVLSNQLSNKVNVFIKIDVGYHRAGIWCENIKEIEKVIQAITQSNILNFTGFLTHTGQNYDAKDEDEILANHGQTLRIMNELKDYFIKDYPNIITSIGNTPACSLSDEFYGIDEIRPGNFVFYDLMQFILGSCHDTDIAVAMACPVIAKHKERNEILIYGGGVHFSKDYISTGDSKLYGSIVKFENDGWTQILAGGYLASLSQEHGILKVNDELFNDIEIGEIIGIIPVHSCMTTSAMKKMLTLQGEIIETMI